MKKLPKINLSIIDHLQILSLPAMWIYVSVCVVCGSEFINYLTLLLFDTSWIIYKNLKGCKT